MYEYRAKIINVVDGDTMDFAIDLGFEIEHKIRVRLVAIDTAEIFHPKNINEKQHGLAAKAYVESLLGIEGTVKTFKDKKGKYGRYLADFFFKEGDIEVSLCASMNNMGFAKRANYNVPLESVEN